MHPNDEHFLVMTAIENPDAPAFRQAAARSPEKIVVEFLARRLLETEYLAAGRIDTLHYGPDRAVLAGRIHGLEHQKYSMAITRSQHALQLFEPSNGTRYSDAGALNMFSPSLLFLFVMLS